MRAGSRCCPDHGVCSDGLLHRSGKQSTGRGAAHSGSSPSAGRVPGRRGQASQGGLLAGGGRPHLPGAGLGQVHHRRQHPRKDQADVGLRGQSAWVVAALPGVVRGALHCRRRAQQPQQPEGVEASCTCPGRGVEEHVMRRQLPQDRARPVPGTASSAGHLDGAGHWANDVLPAGAVHCLLGRKPVSAGGHSPRSGRVQSRHRSFGSRG
mmetsp:Transcript_103536/g.288288  ORF Transcript_103536/g.288288 Transcript_103536/m.288288 type:complete len:209 (-) Transcript_103536:2909-3535(-)